MTRGGRLLYSHGYFAIVPRSTRRGAPGQRRKIHSLWYDCPPKTHVFA